MDENTDLAPIVAQPPAVAPEETAKIDSAQARVDAVSAVLATAYARASTLQLTDEEAAALAEDFPDEAFHTGADGKDNLIYIEHALLRERLNKVLGLGQWAIITRRTWAEPYKTGGGKEAVRMYVEGVLLIRGCMVAEAIGDMSYFPSNAAQNYGDAVEGAKSAALRRLCKEICVGLQAWKKDFAEGWMTRKMEREEAEREAKRQMYRSRGTPTTATSGVIQVAANPASAGTPTAEASGQGPQAMPAEAYWTLLKASKAKFVRVCDPIIADATKYMVQNKLILPTESIEAIDLAHLFPSAREGMTKEAVQRAIAVDYDTHMAKIKFIMDPQPEAPPDGWGEPEPEAPSAESPSLAVGEAPIDAKRRTGRINVINKDTGRSFKGPWTKYGVKIDEDWFNTFDKKIGEAAEAMAGQSVLVHYTEDKFGKKIQRIEPEEIRI